MSAQPPEGSVGPRDNDLSVAPVAQIERLGLGDITAEVWGQLEGVYVQAYHNPHMFRDLLEDFDRRPEVFQLFLARVDDRLVGARVIETKEHPFIDYMGYSPVHGKRFSVLPDFRGRGIGKQLLDEGKRFCFEELDLAVLFGESNEVGALSMYGREGALYHLGSIGNSSLRNSPEENVKFFREFLTNPKFRTFRLPAGDGVQFVYCKDDKTAQLFSENGYVSKAQLLGETSSET